MPIDSAFKQLLLDAIETPQVLSFQSQAEAHSARFQAYNAFKVLKKEDDPFADMKAMLEFIVKGQPDGSATLSIQRKTTNLMQILSGKKLTSPTISIPQPAVDPTITSNLQRDIQRTTPKRSTQPTPLMQRSSAGWRSTTGWRRRKKIYTSDTRGLRDVGLCRRCDTRYV